ncbi:hypothetical protein D3C72_1980780 [compost metagenome]
MRTGRADQIRQAIHRGNAAIDHLLAFFGQVTRRACLLRSLRGVMGNLLGGCTKLVDGRRNAVGAVGLLVGIDHRRVGSANHPQCHFVDLLGG